MADKTKISDNILGVSVILAILLAAFAFHVLERAIDLYLAKWIWGP